MAYSSTNTLLSMPQIGHTQSSGISSNAVPGAIPLSGSPTSGSYTYPHGSHTYFFMIITSILNLNFTTLIGYTKTLNISIGNHINFMLLIAK